MAGDLEPEIVLEAYFRQGVFVARCPACKQSHELQPHLFPKTAAPSMPFACSCGLAYKVLATGLRRIIRKPVKIVGTLLVNTKNVLKKFPCTIVDISTQGVGLSMEIIPLAVNEPVTIRFILDDLARTPFALASHVRRIGKDKLELTVGIKFDEVPLDALQALEKYMKV